MTTSKIFSTDRLESSLQTPSLSVLHLVGSAVSQFYYKLSLIYAREVVQPAKVRSYYAVVHPDGLWQLGESLDKLSAKIPFPTAIARLPQVDVVVPHMFCFPGMTSYRALFEDIVGIPVVGSRAECNALATNKSHTRNIVSSVGVRIAKAQQFKRGDSLTINLPFVVKPNSEDNSMGITLVKQESEIETALQIGFEYDDVLLIEEYIPGRELRVGVIEKEEELYVLPAIEYLLTEDKPIRTVDSKLGTKSDGMLFRQPVNIACPAKISPELWDKLAEAVKNAHCALGCRDYSLYDFRIHSETQEPYLLESCSFWSFINASVLSRMLEADNQKLEEVALMLWNNAAKRTRVACGSLFKYTNADHN
ncbi:D-alanine--D-alanine ligase domain protein [Stanieria cyanosphaera PCC 7437]|uniref:D-alanine--D-alanine ligase domain protein n=1 Tax=Stanieria cyanosphaera (strain ATCC 29371 / PCC 7437) TaxID=111780 RepID=K9Y0T0_STAC7|nr:D-alanine--D-alanine ligase [Stanieria cyanosphaera]AFZ37542.1 D-alanine--D-alanine ligase domain protein [Stanieria cyanosphaera PCC 7437]